MTHNRVRTLKGEHKEDEEHHKQAGVKIKVEFSPGICGGLVERHFLCEIIHLELMKVDKIY